MPVKGYKPDSATHGTKNIIANRLMAVMGKRQRLAVLQLTVNQFPSGKHWRFNSSLPHAQKQDRNLRVGFGRHSASSVRFRKRLAPEYFILIGSIPMVWSV